MTLAILNLFTFILGILTLPGVSGGSDEHDGLEGVTSYHVAFGAVLLICFIVALAFCVQRDIPAPSWHQTIQFDPNIDTGFTSCSDGITIVNRTCVQRHRAGKRIADGAKWGAPLSRGKHVFEISWPREQRSSYATVGVGSGAAELLVQPAYALVGKDKLSWGFDIARRRHVHNARSASHLPGWLQKNRYIPDKFYMYVDCDNGNLGYGDDSDYWGAPVNIPRESFPVYPMVGCMCPDAQVTMTYKGSACGSSGGDRGEGQSISSRSGYNGDGGSSGDDSSGGNSRSITMFGPVGGFLVIPILILLCRACFQRCRGSDNTNGIVLSTPDRNRAQTQDGSKLNYPYSTPREPPPYSTTSQLPRYSATVQPLFNIQDDMKTTQFHRYWRPSQSVQSAPKIHKNSSKMSNWSVMILTRSQKRGLT